MSPRWFPLFALLSGQACAPESPPSYEAIPCTPGETVCLSLGEMGVCAPDGLSFDADPCGAAEACWLRDVPGARCEPRRSPRTFEENLAATLRVRAPSGATCTAFLVAADVIVTNEHCCRDPGQCVDALVEPLARGAPQLEPAPYRVSEALLLAPEHDAAILRVDGRPGDDFAPVVLTRGRPGRDEVIYLAGHPEGRPLEASLGILFEYRAAIDFNYASGTRTKRDQALYWAHGEGGNSGSPVFLARTHTLVAMHHSGNLRAAEYGFDPATTGGFAVLLAGTDSGALLELLARAGVTVEVDGADR
jgi:hypothetical protein